MPRGVYARRVLSPEQLKQLPDAAQVAEEKAVKLGMRDVLDDDLVTSEWVAARMSMSIRTLWRLVQQGKFPPPVRFNRKLVRWVRKHVLDWLSSQSDKLPPLP